MNVNAEHMEMNDDLLIIYLLGEASAQQAKQVNGWRAESLTNEHRFKQFSQVWETGKGLKYDGELDAHASLAKLKQKAAMRKNARARVARIYKMWLPAAAAMLLATAGLWLYRYNAPVKQMQFETAETVKNATLPDGSVITLNKHSKLQYPEKFTGNRRAVVLAQGEAFFSVTHNKALPFIINTGGASIKVVGTSFNVKNKQGNVEVIVETGIVQVSKNGMTVLLNPGEKTLVGPTPARLVKENTPDHLYTYYRSKEFVADDTPLWRMVQVLNEAYDSNIIIGNKELNNLPLNTTFKNESLDDVLQVISRTFKITVERKKNQIILK